MSVSAGRGSAMHLDIIQVRFAPKKTMGPRAGASCLNDRVPEIRKLLRTEMSAADIASAMGVSWPTLKSFIKRRRICDLTERAHFISRQKSIAKLDEHGNPK